MTRERSFATELYCARCGQRYSLDEVHTLCECGKPLLVDYDFERARAKIRRDEFASAGKSIWQYRSLLPVQDPAKIVSLDEGGTPLLHAPRLGDAVGLKSLFLKDESVNPTGSFKARGLAMAVSRAVELGLSKLAIPTAGNAGSALSAYGARAGVEVKVVMPDDSPAPFKVDCVYHGADVETFDGTIADCGHRVAELVEAEGWFSVATLKEPYRIEGKKTMGYELAAQFRYELPDVIIYPTGGGTGLIGMWKAFDEMERLGWIDKDRPRMISVQTEGCAPIPRALKAGEEEAATWENPQTVISGLRVPAAVGDFLILNAIRESGGDAIAVSDRESIECTRELASMEGIFAAPEAGACVAALRRLVESKSVTAEDRVVIFVTGSGYKYLDVLE